MEQALAQRLALISALLFPECLCSRFRASPSLGLRHTGQAREEVLYRSLRALVQLLKCLVCRYCVVGEEEGREMNVAGTRAACKDHAWRIVGDMQRRREIAGCEGMILPSRQLRAP
jgi:hypothetical protein